MFARIESILRQARRRLSRSEWAIRHLGLAPSEGTAEEPGLLLIQIDGLARVHLEKAIAQGRMPFLRRLIRHNGYEWHAFYPGLPTTTPAVQAELFYGVRSAVPAFAFLDRRQQDLSVMFSPAPAKEREAACAAQAEGLLRDGSSWSNIYTGGAGPHEAHFCIASNSLADLWRTGKFGNLVLFSLLQLPAALRIAGLLTLELGAAVRAALLGIRHGRKPSLEFTTVLSRVFIATGLRELIRIGGRIDVTRGLPIVHANFVGYDEHAHRRGPGSRFALRSLRGIDRAIKGLWREAQKSRRRDYSVWIYSDHGQEHTRSFALEFPGGVERMVREVYDELRAASPPDQPPDAATQPEAEGPRAWHRRRYHGTPQYFVSSPDQPFVLAALGPVGHLYFKEPLDDAQRRRFAERLVHQHHVPGVLLQAGDGTMTWVHARGATRIPDEVPPLLTTHPEPLRQEIARDLVTWLQHPHSGDLVLVGWSPWSGAWTFAPENGSHAGFGPEETQGFALLPSGTRLPPGTEHFIRPSALRVAALHHLGRSPLTAWRPATRHGSHLRLMTYNTHGCSGMDGRVSPRRIARAIREQAPDVVALQELDLGRRRSRAEDQSAIIARELGMHAVFCPTVTRGDEHYGHALLSHWPIEIVKRARLPDDPHGWWDEPRSGLWARIQVAGHRVNVVTAHLGLGVHERELQMRALLGPEWLGPILDAEPIILCGDFNLLPGSTPYRLASARLRDVQLLDRAHRPLNTFSSMHPLLRIDHMFVSRHFQCDGIVAVRNDLTRVASDHLPLRADLRVLDAGAGTTTRNPPRAPGHTPPACPVAGA
ncbi:endonuclease/exonuclease/phosphatase family protein [Opitutus sp. ER46]|uniref:endonuclease/exonuclease/phosphatase family protein n=1 Tax=Opitutus sp. ER46 TaxID=2161864 RepID=UPI000D30D7B9|nr:endonuclease/exonuclease/phosphatase family protein [Opitutus sp. ER46]PTX97915.1 endonuclease [Opitutus sp. ER46]